MSRRSAAGVERRRVRRPVLVVVGAAWLVLVLAPLTTGPSGAGQGVHHHHHAGASGAGGPAPTVDLRLLAVMVVAMMGPLLVEPLRHVTRRTFPRLRARRAAAVVVGYLGPWLVASVGLALVADGAATALGRAGAVAAALVLAVVWHGTPAHQACLNRTHRHGALAARAHRGDGAAVAAAAGHAGWCIATCGPVMLVAMAAGHGVLAMAGATLWMVAERAEPARRPAWGPVLPRRLLRAAAHRLATPAPAVRPG
ncbi:MAG TPA: DUF2182 domain-containing protein [Iamia sp.]|nr:DUF2182 domain-containing protein [Iamia sp.]